MIFTSGTMGDHLPYIPVGQVLTQRGHQVKMVINQAMHSYAQRAGLEAVAITDIERGPEEAREKAWAWNHWNYPDIRAHPKAEAMSAEAFVAQVRELMDACQDAQLLIATSIRTHGFLAASALKIPWLTVSMNPSTFWIPAVAGEREALIQGRLKEYELLKELIAYAFDELGVREELPPFSLGWLFARHILLASSPYFSLPYLEQYQPRSSIDMTGFWFYQDPDWESWQPDEALRRFCEPEDPALRPVALTFSSQPLENPGEILARHALAAQRLGRRLLVQRGWAGFSEADLPEEIDQGLVMFADYLPHDWLFARSACAIQHGGIGSIARALRQGCPLLVEPFGNDQLYNATRVVDLGVGAAMHPFESTVDGIVETIEGVVLAPETRQRAEALGDKLQAEDGVGTACEYIERYLERLGGGKQHPSIYERFTPPLTPHRKRPRPPQPQNSLPDLRSAPDERARAVGPVFFGGDSIPPILHQTWKDENLPLEFVKYQRTWQERHPDWAYRLWTDADNREFLRQHYPWFLPIYYGYTEPIKRADAVRYFILHHYGGVYVDLDFECLRPLEPLLAGKQVVFGLEPDEHLEIHFPGGRGLRQIVCNAFMSSIPGHPFWEHVFKQLVAYHKSPGPLDATGPFLLTRAYESYANKRDISLETADLLYPVDNQRRWDDLPAVEQARIRESAYAVHHWSGTWWRPDMASQQEPARVLLLLEGQVSGIVLLQASPHAAFLQHQEHLPRLSCLMVTGGQRQASRLAMAQRAVRCFMGQTYPNKELVIVDDGADDSLAHWIAEQHSKALAEGQIAYLRLPDEGRTLGELRNLAVERSSGAYVAQWDDDDLSHPRRLELQMMAIQVLQTDACMLERHQIWWPESQRLAVSTRRIWESSFVCERSKLIPYPARRSGEDTPVIQALAQRGRVALLDLPQLYVYVFHGGNTFQAEHWEAHWQAATETYEGEQYAIRIRELQTQLGVELLENDVTLAAGEAGSGQAAALQDSMPEAAATAVIDKKTETISISPDDMPGILILIPVKDAVHYLPGFWERLRALRYPRQRISLAFLESDSVDGTYGFIRENLPRLRDEFARVELVKRDYAYRSSLPRWEPSEQRRRRSILARSRNYLLARALRDEDWVLWIDVDVARWPQDVIERLLAAGKQIVVPHCLGERSRETFDLNTFKLEAGAEKIDWSPYVIDGILQPPKGLGRLYLSDLRQHDLVEVDAVGSAMLLVKADLHREGLVFPAFPYKLHIESEGLACMAREMGYCCWGLPNLEIFHPD
ncbi:MAG: glycosyltransferase [Anaerolineales bacterium]|nr:glycosyltransferase [Anaerolineales bacterium]